MFPRWEGLKKVLTVGATKIDQSFVRQFTKNLTRYLSTPITEALEVAIKGGPIFMDEKIEKGEYKGTFLKRVQSWLWKNHYVQFGEGDQTLNKIVSEITHGLISSDLYARLDKSMSWNDGDFGDRGSCFMDAGCNERCRYWLKHRKDTYCIQYFTKLTSKPNNIPLGSGKYICQDGVWYSGFGRMWVFLDWPEPGCAVFFNAYPGMELGDRLCPLVIDMLKSVHDNFDPLIKDIRLVNKGSNSNWFYTSSRIPYLIYPKNLSKKYESTTELDIKSLDPTMEKMTEYLGSCSQCKHPVMKDRPHIHSSHKESYTNMKDTPLVHLNLCSKCIQHNLGTCSSCNKLVLYLGKWYSSPMVGKRRKNGDLFCPSCAEHTDKKSVFVGTDSSVFTPSGTDVPFPIYFNSPGNQEPVDTTFKSASDNMCELQDWQLEEAEALELAEEGV